MRARVKWLDNMTFVGESGSGHSVVMDGAPEIGGRNLGLRPMEMVLLGLGGCTAFDVVSMLKKARQPVTGCEIHIEAERSESVPKVFTTIRLNYVIFGHAGISENKVAQAVSLSAEKYCSVSRMLQDRVLIAHQYEIVSADTANHRSATEGTAGQGVML